MSFDKDTIECYIGPSDLNLGPNTEKKWAAEWIGVQLRRESVGALWYASIIVKISLGCNLSKTTHNWCLFKWLFIWIYGNNFLLFYYILFILVLVFHWLSKRKSLLSLIFWAVTFFLMSSYYRENQSVLGAFS